MMDGFQVGPEGNEVHLLDHWELWLAGCLPLSDVR